MGLRKTSTGRCTVTVTMRPTMITTRRLPRSATKAIRHPLTGMRGGSGPLPAAGTTASGSNDLRVPDRRRTRARLHRSFHRTNGDLSMSSNSTGLRALASRRTKAFILAILAVYASSVAQALAHDVTPGDAGYIQEIWGVHIISFIYLGAKHMVTGYDHILFLLGVVFFLYRMKDVAIYVS